VLRIDRVHVEAPLLQGTDDLTLNRGSSRWLFPRTEGCKGRRSDRTGEPGRTETYIVDHLDIVDPANVSVLRSNWESALTLVTCYPFYYVGSAPKRYIVYAVLAKRSGRDLS
jgi:sortase A